MFTYVLILAMLFIFSFFSPQVVQWLRHNLLQEVNLLLVGTGPGKSERIRCKQIIKCTPADESLKSNAR